MRASGYHESPPQGNRWAAGLVPGGPPGQAVAALTGMTPLRIVAIFYRRVNLIPDPRP